MIRRILDRYRAHRPMSTREYLIVLALVALIVILIYFAMAGF